jgi:hypothetical protein
VVTWTAASLTSRPFNAVLASSAGKGRYVRSGGGVSSYENGDQERCETASIQFVRKCLDLFKTRIRIATCQMSERAGSTVVEESGSHAIYLSKPAVVVDLIKQAAEAT